MRMLEVTCPSCSPDEAVEHEVLRSRRGSRGRRLYFEATVRCSRCDTVHRTELRVPKPIEVEAVVSREGESRVETLHLFPDEEVRVGDRLDDLEVTAIEVGEGRAESASAEEADTVWTVDVGVVEVPLSLHAGEKTVSDKVKMGGDEYVEVGETLRRRGEVFTVKSVLTDEGKARRARARDVKRVYGVSGKR
ncbi:MAG: hypothetical protein MAG715_01368 [Methanonatronarchaeales archaeon]|nr:hypothetical protein [Methanonatronarchaeales archaeon]